MQLIIGGAFSGKRNIVKEQHQKCSWLSAYNGDSLRDWEVKWENGTTLVIEGWEKWISEELKNKDSKDIRQTLNTFYQLLIEAEQKQNNQVVLIMVEVGRGIVPIQEEDRMLRDLAGWIAQDAAHLSTEVHIVWNGLSRRMK